MQKHSKYQSLSYYYYLYTAFNQIVEGFKPKGTKPAHSKTNFIYKISKSCLSAGVTEANKPGRSRLALTQDCSHTSCMGASHVPHLGFICPKSTRTKNKYRSIIELKLINYV